MKLQVAIDCVGKGDAIRIVDSTRSFVDRLEAGTPLIKAQGIGILETFRDRISPDPLTASLVADMKTLDGGAIETRLAAEAGAKCVMVSGHASDSTIRHAIKTGKQYGVELMVELDTMLPNILKRAQQVTKIGADSYEYHIGIDYRENGANPVSRRNIKLLKKLDKLNDLAVAGGMNPTRIFNMVQVLNPPIVVVGKAITEAKEPGIVALLCRRAMRGVRP